MKQFVENLLEDWCKQLLKLQIKGTGSPRLDGGLLCPACGRIHGRCFEAMYPFVHMAKTSGDEKWIKAAEQLFDWAEETLSQEDGSFLNDVESGWRGTTVFNTIQLASCLMYHEDIIPENAKKRWNERLRKAAEFLYMFEELNDNNINYPIANALALQECGMVLEESRFIKRAEELSSMALGVFTENGLLFGEGVPRQKKSDRGCCPVDIGYNVEETLPALALYGILRGNKCIQKAAKAGLLAQLDFMTEDGAWDNSFGTRNFKWTYWGSRTSDGCGLGYLLFADEQPEFSLAVLKNLRLMRQCTREGLLTGGPHYGVADQPSCSHHTFTHAKVLAEILDRGLCGDMERKAVQDSVQTIKQEGKLPRQQFVGIRHYPEIDSFMVHLAGMTATVTAYDWEYLPGGHVSGGTLSFLQQEWAGTLFCAGMGEYTLKEPNNMQVPVKVRQECLALRIESQIGAVRYSSIYEDHAVVCVEGNTINAWGELKDIHHNRCPGRKLSYRFCYEWKKDILCVKAEFSEGTLICPMVSQGDEAVEGATEETVKNTTEVLKKDGNNRNLKVKKEFADVYFQSETAIKLPYGTERIFNPAPGFQALRIDLNADNGSTGFSIRVRRRQKKI